jgi:hypothetical protein
MSCPPCPTNPDCSGQIVLTGGVVMFMLVYMLFFTVLSAPRALFAARGRLTRRASSEWSDFGGEVPQEEPDEGQVNESILRVNSAPCRANEQPDLST